MPTGYTAGIAEGVTFEQFILSCARNFGALIMMRDKPSNAEIPVFEPSDFYAKNLIESNRELERLKKMTIAEGCAESDKEFAEAVESHRKRIAEMGVLKSKYEAMLAQVKEWEPPTTDHEGLKKFMVDQLTESIRFDCATEYMTAPKQDDPEQWTISQIKRVIGDIERYTEEDKKEVDRTNQRNRWVADLRRSL